MIQTCFQILPFSLQACNAMLYAPPSARRPIFRFNGLLRMVRGRFGAVPVPSARSRSARPFVPVPPASSRSVRFSSRSVRFFPFRPPVPVPPISSRSARPFPFCPPVPVPPVCSRSARPFAFCCSLSAQHKANGTEGNKAEQNDFYFLEGRGASHMLPVTSIFISSMHCNAVCFPALTLSRFLAPTLNRFNGLLGFGGLRGVKVVFVFRFFFQHVFSHVFWIVLKPKLGTPNSVPK